MDITDNTSNISCSCHALTQNSTVWGSTLLYGDISHKSETKMMIYVQKLNVELCCGAQQDPQKY